MMNKLIRRIWIDVRMTLLFTVSGLLVTYVAGVPVFSMVSSEWNMITIKGAPGYPQEYVPQTSKLVLEPMSTSNQSEIKVPAQGESYGNITCERIALAAPIYYGDTEDCLEKGVGQYTGSGLPGEGKPILIGGHDVTFFAPLEQIEVGDSLVITTGFGDYQYEVTEIKTVEKVDYTVYDLTLPKEQLILYTCYPFGQVIGERSGRYFVFCERKQAAEDTTQ